MFIQVIRGQCTRPEDLQALTQDWVDTLSPGATGWLGSTHGVTDDNQFLGVVRFDSAAAAAASSGRPEQDAWASRMDEVLTSAVEYDDYDDVGLMLDGGSDDAGFVQIIRGRTDDVPRLKRMLDSANTMLRESRPEIIGSTTGYAPDGSWTETVYFTDEASARSAEQQPPPDDMRRELEWAMQGASFHDLHRPWYHSPG